MKKLLYIFVLLLSVAAFPQQKLKKADRLFDEMAYLEAAEAYEAYYENGKNFPDRGWGVKMADSYYFIGNYEKADRWYTPFSGMLDDTHFNRHMQVLKAIGRSHLAHQLLHLRLQMRNDTIALYKLFHGKRYLDSINAQPSPYTITNLPSNSRMADFGTAFYGGKIVYASGKDTVGTGGKIYKRNNQPFLKLYVAERHPEDGSLFGDLEFFPKSQIAYHNATPAFVDSKSLYFSANIVKGGGRPDNNAKGTVNVRLLRGWIDGDNLRTEDLPFNSKEYSVAQPAVSNGQWLYFVSDMPGGYGETDIYKVEIKPDGSYGKPQNLGPAINSPHREMFPFTQNNILYFASDGHYGLGGLDIFKSEITGDVYSEPLNLGKPINSNLDDFAFITSADNAYGYFSSNRAGGRGDDDIYYFTKKAECQQTVSGFVRHKKSQQPLAGATLTVTDKSGEVLASAEADNYGYYIFTLPCNTIVVIEAREEEYTSEKVEVVPSTEGEPTEVNFGLTKYDDLITKEGEVEKITINPIFFDFDKWDITPQAVAELDKVVFVMQSFPDIIIKIESHTDSRGSDDYNMELSANRANATHGYILSKGIAPDRIVSVTGYGETQLVNNCVNGAPCSDEEHLRNRRSEFIIVRK